ncbi:hypothetical protein ACFWYW_58715 [Nonomuraea sp. NPDC059023]|uniref:hypothetical protein n=1 Tax=unclassified Nonomuraea TaxID=2593643 RepID=UPI0036D1A48A
MVEIHSGRALPDLHPDAVALSAFRALPNGVARQYSISEAESKARAIKASLHRASAIGFIKPSTKDCTDCYAVLDVLDADDDIVQDFCIPTARAFKWWYRLLDLRVVA